MASITLPVAEAQIYYVATNGSDGGGNGSSSSPWATISTAVRNVPVTGGTILVRDGTYQGNVRIQRKFTGVLVISAEHRYAAKLRSPNSQTLSVWDAANVVITGFDIARSTCPTSIPLLAQIARSESIALIDNILHDSFNNDVLKINENSRNLLIAGNAISNSQGGSGQHIDINGAANVNVRDNILFNYTAGTGVRGNDTHGFIVAKNSGSVPESRDIRIINNVFLNYEGNTGSNFVLLGEDGYAFHEVQGVIIENNLMLGNSSNRMRAPLGIKSAKDVTFRNNTVFGDLPSSAFAFRMNREGSNPRNRDIRYWNNIWADPVGTMGNFSDGYREESVSVELDNNIYWNNGALVCGCSSYDYTDDPRHTIANPVLTKPVSVVMPRWWGTQFSSAKKTVREEFERLVTTYGLPGTGSAAIGRSDPAKSPARDIFGRLRGPDPDTGAVEKGAVSSTLRIVPLLETLAGTVTTTINQVMLAKPAAAGGLTVQLSNSNSSLVQVPASVKVPAGGIYASFTITARPVTAPTQVSIRAAAANGADEVPLTLLPVRISSVNLGPDEMKGGTLSTHNLVWFSGAVGSSGATVTLSSSRPDLVTVPASVAAAAGKSYSAYFNVTTKKVSATTVVTIKASWGGYASTVDLRLNP